MLKKIIGSLALLTMSMSVAAAEKVTIIWPFNIGSNQANTVRAMILEANAKQDRYEFILDNKPGAGGAVAAKYTLEHPTNTILAMSSSFFIRPNFDDVVGSFSYNLNSFQPVLIQATGSPIAVLSKTHNSMKSALGAKELTVGIAGFGTISHLVAANINEQSNNVKIIPYPSMIAADKDVIGEHIAASTDFLGDIGGYVGSDLVNILGITGTRQVGNLKTLEQLGVKGFDNLVANYAMYASKEMPQSTLNDIHSILNSVNSLPLVVDSYNKDILTPVNMDLRQSNKWYSEQSQFWKMQSGKVKR